MLILISVVVAVVVLSLVVAYYYGRKPHQYDGVQDSKIKVELNEAKRKRDELYRQMGQDPRPITDDPKRDLLDRIYPGAGPHN